MDRARRYHGSGVDRNTYLVGPDWRAQKICLEFILRGAFQLVPSSAKSLHRVAALMERYRNVPMDFADGTLVALGEELETDNVFTLDRRGFSVYRMNLKNLSKLSHDPAYEPDGPFSYLERSALNGSRFYGQRIGMLIGHLKKISRNSSTYFA